MNRQTPNGNQVKKPSSHHLLSVYQPYIFFADDLAHWDTGTGPVRIRRDTAGGELHELIEKAIAKRPKRPKVIDPATGQERRNEPPIPTNRIFCSQT